jgi:hypothetical protein
MHTAHLNCFADFLNNLIHFQRSFGRGLKDKAQRRSARVGTSQPQNMGNSALVEAAAPRPGYKPVRRAQP